MSLERHQSAPAGAPAALSAGETRAYAWGCFSLYFVGIYLVLGPRVNLAAWQASPDANTALAEAIRWKHGHLDLAQSFYEDAEVDGRFYNVVGLAFTLLAVAGTALTERTGGLPDTLSSFWYAALVALPLPIAAFAAFRAIVRDSAWAAVLAGYLVMGTCIAPVLVTCRTGSVYYINHVLAVTGLMLLAGDLLGPRRIWPAVIGLALAAWSRQMTLLYAIPLIWVAMRRGQSFDPELTEVAHSSGNAGEQTEGPGLGTRYTVHRLKTGATALRDAVPGRKVSANAVAIAGVLIVVAVPMTLNWLKFGNPLDSGYGRMFEGRTDRIGTRAQEALFSPRYFPMHLRGALLDFPAPDIRKDQLYLDRAGLDGGSMFFTSPLLLGVFVTLPRWWRDVRRRLLMLSTLPVVLSVMCYATTGSEDSGYYRYALDFIPVWLLVAAPWLVTPRAHAWTLACLAFSSLYFYLIG